MQLTSLPFHSNETFLVETPKCLDLVDDLSFCGTIHPTRSLIQSKSNFSSSSDQRNLLENRWKKSRAECSMEIWNWLKETLVSISIGINLGNKKRGPESFINFDISMKHFESEDASVECQNVEKQRKIVSEVRQMKISFRGDIYLGASFHRVLPGQSELSIWNFDIRCGWQKQKKRTVYCDCFQRREADEFVVERTSHC